MPFKKKSFFHSACFNVPLERSTQPNSISLYKEDWREDLQHEIPAQVRGSTTQVIHNMNLPAQVIVSVALEKEKDKKRSLKVKLRSVSSNH